MPDSRTPNSGLDSYDGWDLEDLLSGANVRLPEGMRPVAGSLAALRAAPTRAELAGEARARAAFLRNLPAQASEPDRAGPAGDGPTLILPTRTAGGGPHAVRGPRHSHRRPPKRGRWQPKALAGAAAGAAVVIVGGIALAGGFSGGGGHPGQPGQSSSAASATTPAGGAGSGARGLEGTATKEPTAHPTPSASGGQPSSAGSGAGSGRSALCRQYWAFLAHPESPARWAAEKDTLHQLSELAGSPWNVSRYCTGYYAWGSPPAPMPDAGNNRGGPGPQGPGDSQGGNQQKPHLGNAGNGDGGDGGGNGAPGDPGGQGSGNGP
jgi:hypothetical protein